MKWKTPEPREYYAKYEEVKLDNGRDWFQCYRLPGDIYAVCEPQHLQEVNCFLIMGEDHALLMDTGMGILPLRPVIAELLNKFGPEDSGNKAAGPAGSALEKGTINAASQMNKLEVVNCHRHFDHVGGNYEFFDVMTADVEPALMQGATGIDHLPLTNQCEDEDMFLFGYPKGFVPSEYWVRPYRARGIEDGHVFDLGGREVEFITTPGHTEDHAMLYDRKSGILFGGDMIYLATIYAQFDSDFMGHSDVSQYVESLRKVKERCPDMTAVYASHNEFLVAPEAVDVLIGAFDDIREGRAEGKPLKDEKYGYYDDPEVILEYGFEGFSIVVAG